MADQKSIREQEEARQKILDTFLAIYNREEEEKYTLQKAQSLGITYVNLVGQRLESKILSIIPEDIVKSYGLIAYSKSGPEVKVASFDPKNTVIQAVLKDLEESSGFKFTLALASRSSIRYGQKVYDLIVPKKVLQVKIQEGVTLESKIRTLSQLKEAMEKASTTELVDLILSGAIASQASDIHLEPSEKKLRVRYRIDGVLHDVVFLPKETIKPISSRLKFLAKLKLDVTRQPQDGKFFIRLDERRIDVRLSSLPSSGGESLTLRIFDKEAESLVLEELGLGSEDYKKVEEVLAKSSGMILSCGPTGSGKTTTLYAILDKLNKPGINIITLEDPIEYSLPGIVQSQVDEEVGYNFKTGLRSILRQDPDVIMVGEIRDLETAEMAVQAALTGHIMLSTLHTNDASGAIPRLIDLGVKPFLIVNALNLVIAQRLVRRICQECKESYFPPQEIEKAILSQLSKIKKSLSGFQLYRGRGCDGCNQTGYKGRIGIFEVLIITGEIQDLILKQASSLDIKKAALEAGLRTMEQDGLLKAIEGVTTPEEIWRVIKE